MAGSGGIFVSYRRGDTAPATGRLADMLVDRFGRARVFMDVESIEPGQDFSTRIDRAVGACDVMLAMIGPNGSARWTRVDGGASTNRTTSLPWRSGRRWSAGSW